MRVYVINPMHLDVAYEELTDEEFMEQAENKGDVYTLVGFQVAFNEEDVDTSIDVIRII